MLSHIGVSFLSVAVVFNVIRTEGPTLSDIIVHVLIYPAQSLTIISHITLLKLSMFTVYVIVMIERKKQQHIYYYLNTLNGK